MKRCLAIATLALGLVAFGCDDEDDGGTGGRGGTGGSTGGRGGTGGTGGSTGGTGGATGGTGGATGGTGGATGGTGGATGGTGGATGGTGGTAGDAGMDMAPSEGGVDMGGGGDAGDMAGANICSAYVAGSGALAGIEPMAFCLEYASACTFGGDMRYTNMGDCITKYMNAATAVKTCRAGHLCNASQGNAAAKTTHCPHATGLGAVAACVGP